MKKEWEKPTIEILDVKWTMKGFDPPVKQGDPWDPNLGSKMVQAHIPYVEISI